MNNIVFATTFRNERSASGSPVRTSVLNSGGTILAQSVTADGYTISLRLRTLNSFWQMSVPNHYQLTKQYVKRSIRLKPTDVSLVQLNVFGFQIVGGAVAETVLDPDTVYHFCSVVDVQSGLGRAYINGRLVGMAVDSADIRVDKLTNEVANHDWSALMTDVICCESDDPAPIAVQFADLELTEVSNQDWLYSGPSLLGSLDKTEVVSTEPNVNTYLPNAQFTLAHTSELPVLIETAGSSEGLLDRFGLMVGTSSADEHVLQPMSEVQSAFHGVVVEGGLDFYVRRDVLPMVLRLEVTEPGQQVHLRTLNGDGLVSWGDGEQQSLTNGLLSHTFSAAGTYSMQITGVIEQIEVSGGPIIGLMNWGYVEGLQRLSFYDTVNGTSSPNLMTVPTTIPPSITSTAHMFRASGYNGTEVGSWNTTRIVNMESMFRQTTFNQPLTWSTVSLTIAHSMFQDNPVFNQPIGTWWTESLTGAQSMFEGCTAFNQDLSWWCVEYLPTKPDRFDEGAVNWTEPKPQWGTPCPIVFRLDTFDTINDFVDTGPQSITITKGPQVFVSEDVDGKFAQFPGGTNSGSRVQWSGSLLAQSRIEINLLVKDLQILNHTYAGAVLDTRLGGNNGNFIVLSCRSNISPPPELTITAADTMGPFYNLGPHDYSELTHIRILRGEGKQQVWINGRVVSDVDADVQNLANAVWRLSGSAFGVVVGAPFKLYYMNILDRSTV